MQGALGRPLTVTEPFQRCGIIIFWSVLQTDARGTSRRHRGLGEPANCCPKLGRRRVRTLAAHLGAAVSDHRSRVVESRCSTSGGTPTSVNRTYPAYLRSPLKPRAQRNAERDLPVWQIPLPFEPTEPLDNCAWHGRHRRDLRIQAVVQSCNKTPGSAAEEFEDGFPPQVACYAGKRERAPSSNRAASRSAAS